jgi:hypothetical protein
MEDIYQHSRVYLHATVIIRILVAYHVQALAYGSLRSNTSISLKIGLVSWHCLSNYRLRGRVRECRPFVMYSPQITTHAYGLMAFNRSIRESAVRLVWVYAPSPYRAPGLSDIAIASSVWVCLIL